MKTVNEDKPLSENELEQLKVTLADYKGEDRVVPAQEIITELEDERKIFNFNLHTRIPTLDKLIGGFKEGQLNIVSGPTGHGKTSFCRTLSKKFQDQDIHSLWFSYEMSPLEFHEQYPDANPNYFIPRQLKTGDYSWIRERLIESKIKHNTKIVFIDHLHFLVNLHQLIQVRNTSLLFGHVLRKLKSFAIENHLVIFLVCHLTKLDLEKETPSLNDLRDSSFIAQEADNVMIIFRPTISKKGQPAELDATSVLSIVKNRRRGELGNVKLTYFNNKYEECAPSI